MNMKLKWMLGFVVLMWAQALTAQEAITLSDLWSNRTFSASYVSGFNFLNDGQHYTKQVYNREKAMHEIKKYNLKTGEEVAVIFSGDALKASDAKSNGRFAGYTFSADESKLLIETDVESIYRHSYKATYYVVDLKAQAAAPVRLSEGGQQQLAAFSPAGDKVAFVRDNNLFYKDLATGDERQITSDGQKNSIINGLCDWVYEEEFGQDRAFYWSPDGQKIAFMRFDESAVREFSMPMYYNGAYPEPYTFKYPKAGETNATVTVHTYNLATGATQRMKTGDETDIYFPRIKWTQDPNTLCITRLNRHQNHLELLLADATTGATSLLLEERNNYYVDIHDDLTFLKDGEHFVWSSEQSGYNHLYRYNMEGERVNAITSGDYDVTAFYGVDEANGLVYYQSAETSPMERHLYRVKLDGKRKKAITSGDGQYSAQFSGTYDLMVVTHSTLNTPATYAVYSNRGKMERMIEDNQRLRDTMSRYGFAKAEFMTIPTDDAQLNAWIIKPADFDKSKQYPVLMYVYGGPGSQTVRDAWGGSNFVWFQMLAQKGYIVVSVDNRGTGARGEAFKKVTYQELGKYETIDQINAAKWLANQDYIDGTRIGIFGWSYGGYMSSLCLFKGNDVFKSAIAVAPVTNWKWYDSIYTERYMRTPQENKSGYENNSPVNFADRLKGNYLLVHGIADDNVHFQNAAEMANALIRENKQFDTYFYPNRNHGIYGDNARLHLYTKMTHFLMEKL